MHRYSFSGADARPYVYFPTKPQDIYYLESMHTVAFSVHEAKGDVRTLGYRNIRGFTRSIRTIAGSMIFIVVDDHPLRTLIRTADKFAGWSVDQEKTGVGTAQSKLEFRNRLPTLLPPFNLLVTYVTELANTSISGNFVGPVDPGVTKGAGVLLEGIEFIDDGLVSSVNDVVSEMTFSFKARDIRTFASTELHNIPIDVSNDMLSSFDQVSTASTKQSSLAGTISQQQGYVQRSPVPELTQPEDGGVLEVVVDITSDSKKKFGSVNNFNFNKYRSP